MAEPVLEAGRPPDRTVRRLVLAARAVVALVLGVQFALLVHRSWAQWSSGAVSMDFAIFSQAWHQIGSGDLDPFSTIVGYPYWRSHLEVLIWPMSLVGLVFPSGFTLLVLQDLAIVGSEALAVLWVLEAVRRRESLRPVHLVPVAATLLLFVTSDRIGLAALGDFHFQPFATFFLLGAGRALWAGRRWPAAVWVLLALSTGDVAGTYVAGLGVSAMVARRDTRLPGLVVVLAGGVWVLTVGALNANIGSQFAGYEPLVGRPLPQGGAALVVLASTILLHPGRPWAVLRSKTVPFENDLSGTGVLGLLHPWTAGVSAVVLLAAGLQNGTSFVVPFQTFPAIVFTTAGTGLALDWLSRRRLPGRTSVAPGRVLLAAGLAVSALFVVRYQPPAEPGYPEPAGVARQLAAVDRATGEQDQVIASFGIVGRFAGREDVRLYYTPGPVPVTRERVVFVLSSTIGNVPDGAAQEQAVADVRALGARVLVDTPDVHAFVWEPPPGTTQVVLGAPPG